MCDEQLFVHGNEYTVLMVSWFTWWCFTVLTAQSQFFGSPEGKTGITSQCIWRLNPQLLVKFNVFMGFYSDLIFNGRFVEFNRKLMREMEV